MAESSAKVFFDLVKESEGHIEMMMNDNLLRQKAEMDDFLEQQARNTRLLESYHISSNAALQSEVENLRAINILLHTELDQRSVKRLSTPQMESIEKEISIITSNLSLQSLRWDHFLADESFSLITHVAGIDVFSITHRKCSEISPYLREIGDQSVVLCYGNLNRSVSIALDMYECLRRKWSVRVALLIEADRPKLDFLPDILSLGAYADSLRTRFNSDIDLNCFFSCFDESQEKIRTLRSVERYFSLREDWQHILHGIYGFNKSPNGDESSLFLKRRLCEKGTIFVEE